MTELSPPAKRERTHRPNWRVLVQPLKQIPVGVRHDLIVFDRHCLASARLEIFQGNESEASVVPLNLVEGRMIERATCPSEA